MRKRPDVHTNNYNAWIGKMPEEMQGKGLGIQRRENLPVGESGLWGESS